jgi:membrane fusion protein (multidrug efflux system)
VGEWINDGWIIEKGLAAGDKVIVDGIQKVQPGGPVKPSPFGAPAKGEAPAKPAAAQPAPAK